MIESFFKGVVKAPTLVLLLAAIALVWGWQAFRANPKDAIPDIAENQVIVAADWPGRSPKDVDEQITYPLTAALQGLPGVHEVRAVSGFGWGMVSVIFGDEVDFYWGRDRVQERLDTLDQELPEGVAPRLGPDATALGQIFWYTVENGWYCPRHPGLRFRSDGGLDPNALAPLKGPSGFDSESLSTHQCPVDGGLLERSRLSLDALRSLQDYQIALALESVPGVSEVAGVGGYVREYHVDVDPEALRAFSLTMDQVAAAVKASNLDVGAEVLEESGTELLVRGVGFLGGEERKLDSWKGREAAVVRDLEAVVLKASDGTPVTLAQVAGVSVGPGFRRGALDRDGVEVVGASVIMRFGDNPLEVLSRVKEGIRELEQGLPPGIRIRAFYDRSELIGRTLRNLGDALGRELVITIAVVALFLLHFRASLTVAITLPLAVLLAFVGMEALGVGSNIMSLAGIAIAIGTMVDMAIVMTENIYQHLVPEPSSESGNPPASQLSREERNHRIAMAAREVGPAIATAIATTVISFLPVFLLQGQSGKLFVPLAWTKTLCLVAAAAVALLVVPALARLTLVERQIPKARAGWLAAGCGILVAGLWILGARWVEALEELRWSVGSVLAVPRPVDAVLVGGLAGVAVWSAFRERLRPQEENPVNRVILRGYGLVLAWALAHPWRFFAIPAVIVVAGLAAWLGPATLLGPALDLSALLGLDITHWSLAWWIHLGAGAVLGFLVLPLLWDTVSGRLPDGSRGPWVRPAVLVALALGTAWLAHGLGLARALPSPALRTLGLPELDAATGQAGEARTWAPVAAWRARSSGIGQEYMPPLDEGDFLYMPSLLPAASINTVMDVMQKQDIQLAAIPEVETAVGKLGRIDSSLDPAPLGMVETLVALKPREEWPRLEDPDEPGRFRRRSSREVWEAIQDAGRFPGVLPSVELQPIRARVEMLSTGLGAEIGLKVFGDTLEAAEEAAVAVEGLLRRELEGAESVNAVRTNNKPYLEIHVDRQAAARYGIASAALQRALEVAVGGVALTTTYEGLHRYPVRVRYPRELRDDPQELGRVLVAGSGGAQIPLSQVATLRRSPGPMSIRREGARYVSYVTLSSGGLDDSTLVARASQLLDRAVADGRLTLPLGTQLQWSGTYERHVAASKRLAIIVPLVLAINGALLFLHFRRLSMVVLVFLALPVSFAGGFLMLRVWPGVHHALHKVGLLEWDFAGDAVYLTVAVWVGFIALFGIAVDDGIVMGTYLQRSFKRSKISACGEIDERVAEAGRRRIRPCLMTTVTTVMALIPVLLSTGSGSDVMVPMALPVFGGMVFELVSLFVVPVGFAFYLRTKWRWGWEDRWFQRSQPVTTGVRQSRTRMPWTRR